MYGDRRPPPRPELRSGPRTRPTTSKRLAVGQTSSTPHRYNRHTRCRVIYAGPDGLTAKLTSAGTVWPSPCPVRRSAVVEGDHRAVVVPKTYEGTEINSSMCVRDSRDDRLIPGPLPNVIFLLRRLYSARVGSAATRTHPSPIPDRIITISIYQYKYQYHTYLPRIIPNDLHPLSLWPSRFFTIRLSSLYFRPSRRHRQHVHKTISK